MPPEMRIRELVAQRAGFRETLNRPRKRVSAIWDHARDLVIGAPNPRASQCSISRNGLAVPERARKNGFFKIVGMGGGGSLERHAPAVPWAWRPKCDRPRMLLTIG